MPITHTLIKVAPRDHAALVAFYTAALAPIGYKQLGNFPSGMSALGVQRPEWFMMASEDTTTSGVHVCFSAPDRAAVDAFHAAAIATGGKDNGTPGVRERMSPNYYAAFAFDTQGNNIEVAFAG
ncbi:hypothetical protein NKR23_g11085 [Pleurostoma richardsiae]|uniref:VOC domain-containing protein n=1 Tax=Pleurostoma richardsiae TaxID=41990 RepID=A0AA38R416_9PEZI|nr:hypothetical protein NKR23_g11085 [Pleurostoma richardsiae]